MYNAIVITQVEETFMQHVVQYWQGSLPEADSTAAMPADPEAAAYGGPVHDQGGQATPVPLGEGAHQDGHPSNPLGSHGETTGRAVAGKRSHWQAQCFLSQLARFALQKHSMVWCG